METNSIYQELAKLSLKEEGQGKPEMVIDRFN